MSHLLMNHFLDENLDPRQGARSPSDIADSLLGALKNHGLTIGVAESLTGGQVCSALVSIAGSSEHFRGGIIAYSPDLKSSILNVDTALLATGGTVQSDVAAQMALGVAKCLVSDIGVATTGIAGPGDTKDGPRGLVFVAVSYRNETVVRRYRFEGDRNEVRFLATCVALSLALEVVTDISKDAL